MVIDSDDKSRLAERFLTDLGGSFGLIEDLSAVDEKKLERMCQRSKLMPVY